MTNDDNANEATHIYGFPPAILDPNPWLLYDIQVRPGHHQRRVSAEKHSRSRDREWGENFDVPFDSKLVSM